MPATSPRRRLSTMLRQSSSSSITSSPIHLHRVEEAGKRDGETSETASLLKEVTPLLANQPIRHNEEKEDLHNAESDPHDEANINHFSRASLLWSDSVDYDDDADDKIDVGLANDIDDHNTNSASYHPLSRTHQHLSASQLPNDMPTHPPEAQLWDMMDQLEDDWDASVYQELIPLDVRLALEETLFGWSHLSADIVAHTAFMVGAFGLVFLGLWWVTPLYAPVWLRWTLALMAAWASFRMVRRRRQIYLRAAYGSKEYNAQSERRQLDVMQADQEGWLGRLRQRRRQRNMHRQLQNAESNFIRHYTRKLERAQFAPLTDNDVLKKNQIEDNPPSFTDLSPLRRTRRESRASFRTDPVPVMQSVQEDQTIFASGPIRNMPYVHGGFYGAAPFLLANPHWIAILRQLMPDVYVEISRRVAKAAPQRLIHWAENNPVVAAYGTAQELEYNGSIPNMEWDVFLNPILVQRVDIVLRHRQAYLEKVLPERARIAAVLAPLGDISHLTQQAQTILHFFETELYRRVRVLTDKMLIAHGKLSQLMLEQTGWAKHYNYSRVKRTRRTLGGGIYARQWLAVYAEALELGISSSDNRSADSSPERSDSPTLAKAAARTLKAVTEKSCPNTSLRASVHLIRAIAHANDNHCDPFGLILDVKSRHVPPRVWACVTDTLRAADIRVEGVGSFTIDDIRGVSAYVRQPINEIAFFHSAGDLQRACHDGRIRPGDVVFFNGGSLLWKPLLEGDVLLAQLCRNCVVPFDAVAAKRQYAVRSFGLPSRGGASDDNATAHSTTSTVQDYQRCYNLSIGLYVQEFQIDETAIDILVRLVNDHPELYNRGLSWGGVNGITIRGIQPGRFTSTDGFWNQRYAGQYWDPELHPPPLLPSSSNGILT